MFKFRLAIVAAALMGVGIPWVGGQDPKSRDSKDAAPRLRGQLPQSWGKLGLSDEQKQKIYGVQDKYRSKIDALNKQIAELKDQERKDMEGVLTAAQKARLREILAGRAPSDSGGKDKNKP